MDTLILYAVALSLLVASLLKSKEKTLKALRKSLKALENLLPQLLMVLVFVAIALSIFDAQLISRFLGNESGFFGVIAAAIVGSITLIPGFVAFPAASELLRNGAGVLQIAAFVSSLMMVGVVTLPMEIAVFGRRTTFLRNLFAFIFVFPAAAFVAWVVQL